MPKQLAFYFEQQHCVGCMTCQVACKDKNNLAAGQCFRKVKEVAGGSYTSQGAGLVPHIYAFWLSVSCNHCAKPVCAANCPTGALEKRGEDGIVIVDQEKCSGCQQCIKTCPYDALAYNPLTGKVGKCDFCRDLLAAGKQPVCVAACPMRALDYGLLEELQQKYGSVNQTKGLPSPQITEPSLVITPHRDAVII
ncbi:MAG: dimethylsulfoxide reductase, chain [Firmicutes bacterium]|nr:dimethylsulfoxide reductase, chain [Bacillota bacterium]